MTVIKIWCIVLSSFWDNEANMIHHPCTIQDIQPTSQRFLWLSRLLSAKWQAESLLNPLSNTEFHVSKTACGTKTATNHNLPWKYEPLERFVLEADRILMSGWKEMKKLCPTLPTKYSSWGGLCRTDLCLFLLNWVISFGKVWYDREDNWKEPDDIDWSVCVSLRRIIIQTGEKHLSCAPLASNWFSSLVLFTGIMRQCNNHNCSGNEDVKAICVCCVVVHHMAKTADSISALVSRISCFTHLWNPVFI